MNTEPKPKIAREYPPDISASAQVNDLVTLHGFYLDAKHDHDQTRRIFEKTANPLTVAKTRREREAAIPVLKLAVLEQMERIEKLPQSKLKTLTTDEHQKLHWILFSIRQERAREAELEALQQKHNSRERDHDRSR